MDLEKAIAYVLAQGNAVERARLAAILWDEPPPEAVLQELAALQKPDGGFGYWVREVSNVCDTAYVLQWFDDLKVYRLPTDHSLVTRCLADLERKQRPDGSWEPEEGEEHAVNATVAALRALKGYGLI